MKKCRKPLSLRHFGTPGGARTHGLSLRRRPLYPTELRAQIRYNPRQGRPNTFRLGGGRSILLSYGCRCMGYYTTLIRDVQAQKNRIVIPVHAIRILHFSPKNIRKSVKIHSKCKNPIAIPDRLCYNNYTSVFACAFLRTGAVAFPPRVTACMKIKMCGGEMEF